MASGHTEACCVMITLSMIVRCSSGITSSAAVLSNAPASDTTTSRRNRQQYLASRLIQHASRLRWLPLSSIHPRLHRRTPKPSLPTRRPRSFISKTNDLGQWSYPSPAVRRPAARPADHDPLSAAACLAGRPVSPLAHVRQAADPRAGASYCLVQQSITDALFPAASRSRPPRALHGQAPGARETLIVSRTLRS